jgi:hypothetical protein
LLYRALEVQMDDKARKQLTAEQLADRLTPKPAPRRPLAARLALCLGLAGGVMTAAPESDAWAEGETSSDTAEQAFSNGFNAGVADFNATGTLPSIAIGPDEYGNNHTQLSAWFEGFFSGAHCAASGDDCPGCATCATCSCSCGCGCGCGG